MAKVVTLDAQPRSEIGRGAVQKIRADGYLPAVIYGKGIDTLSVSIVRHDLIRALHSHGMHALVTLKIEGGREYLALVKEVQIDAVRQEALHVDFQRVEEDKPVQTEVVVEVTGTPAGVKEGGVLEVQLRTVVIEALPLSIPENIEFDVSGLNIGDVARVGDLAPPEAVTILTDHEETLLSVAAPRVEEEVAAVPEEGVEVPEGEEPPADAEGEAEAAEGDDTAS